MEGIINKFKAIKVLFAIIAIAAIITFIVALFIDAESQQTVVMYAALILIVGLAFVVGDSFKLLNGIITALVITQPESVVEVVKRCDAVEMTAAELYTELSERVDKIEQAAAPSETNAAEDSDVTI